MELVRASRGRGGSLKEPPSLSWENFLLTAEEEVLLGAEEKVLSSRSITRSFSKGEAEWGLVAKPSLEVALEEAVSRKFRKMQVGGNITSPLSHGVGFNTLVNADTAPVPAPAPMVGRSALRVEAGSTNRQGSASRSCSSSSSKSSSHAESPPQPPSPPPPPVISAMAAAMALLLATLRTFSKGSSKFFGMAMATQTSWGNAD
mmetsp:Transcript_63877/g.125448  ORF Transcript_63877/g.125448 Transcript_63877/m.125448 type:complete len:203 (-) Transcript_63877:1757-2365(-)